MDIIALPPLGGGTRPCTGEVAEAARGALFRGDSCSANGSVSGLLRPSLLHPVRDSCPCLLWLQPELHPVCSGPSRGRAERREPRLRLAGQRQRGIWGAPGTSQQQRGPKSRQQGWLPPRLVWWGCSFGWLAGWAQGLAQTDLFPGRALLPGADSPTAAPGGSVPVSRSPCISRLGPHLGRSDIKIMHNNATRQ